MKYGDRITYLRNQRNLTQKELAERTGISRAALSHYEKNRREPDYDTLLRFAFFFECSTDYILGKSDDPELTEKEKIQRDSDVSDWEKNLESFPDDERKSLKEMISDYADYIIKKKRKK